MKRTDLPSPMAAARLPLQKALGAIRQHLDMDVAYLSRIVDGKSIFEQVDAPGLEHLVKPGDERSLDDVYCNHILEGRLPELMPDTADEPIAVGMPITTAVPIGAHMSIPVRLQDGSVYGMFCCLSARPNPSLNERDLGTMRMFADLAAERIGDAAVVEQDIENKRLRICAAMNDGFDVVFQPIRDLATNEVVGFESLSRFAAEPYRPPNVWFDEAAEIGMGVELELAAIRRALHHAERFEDDVYVSINASPETILDPAFQTIVELSDRRHRLTLEITEHARVDDYTKLHEALAPVRKAGVRLAVDDAGAGYASLSHILQLKPDIIKLDMSLVQNVDTDEARYALASGMVMFARELGILVIGEGIETEAECKTLKQIGIFKGQGYHLGRPAPVKDLTERARLTG